MANMVTSIVMELVDRVTRPVRRIQQALSGLGRRAGLDRLAGAARRAGRAMSDVVGQARALGERFLMMGGLAAGAVWGTERLVSGVTDVGTAVQESAERLRVGTTWLQEWQYVGRQFGVDNDAMVDGLKELGLRADEFVMTSKGPAAEAFGRLGIGLQDLRATGGRTAEMFDLVRSRMGRLENDAARQRVMDEIFGGQGGEQMVAMLGATNEELEKIMQRGRERGAILTPEEIKNSREYTNQMGDLRQMLFGVQVAVVGELLPAINEWIERMGLLGQANREAVATDIVDGIREIWRGLQLVGTAVSWAANEVGGFGNLIAIISGLLAGRFLVSLAMAAWSIWGLSRQIGVFLFNSVMMMGSGLIAGARWLMMFGRAAVLATVMNASMGAGLIGLVSRAVPAAIAGIKALSLALLTTPIGWAIAAIAALAGAVYLIYRNWAEVGPWFAEMWAGIQAWFTQGIGGIMRDLASWHPAALFMRAIDAIFEMFGARPLSAIAGEWLSGVADQVTALWADIGERFSQGVAAATEWVAALWRGVQSWFSQGIGGIMRSLARWSPAGLVVQALDAIFEAFGARPLSAMVAEWFAGVRERVTTLWADMQAWFSQGIGAVTRDVLAFNPAALLGRVIDEVFALFTGRPLSQVGAEWIDTLMSSVREAWQALPDWADERISALGEVFARFSLADVGGDWIDSLRNGISERWEGLTGWLSAKMDSLTGWMPDWARDGLGIQSAPPQPSGSPQAALGAPVAEGRPSAMPAPARAEVGGELRIVVDSEGRPRVAESRRRGGMEFDVMSGGLGVMP